MVFCRDRGWKDEDEAVEALDGVWSMTDMVAAVTPQAIEVGCRG